MSGALTLACVFRPWCDERRVSLGRGVMTCECFQEEEIRRARADTDETRRKLLAGVPPHPNPQRFANPLGETHELATFRESAWVATLLSRVHERPFVGYPRMLLEPLGPSWSQFVSIYRQKLTKPSIGF